MMPAPPKAGRRSFFRHGQVPFASKTNVFIYGSNSVPTQTRQTELTSVTGNGTKYGLSADNQFTYGTNENTPIIVDKSYNKRSGFPLDVKTSREIRKKALQAQEARDDYANFLKSKQHKLIERDNEKRKDFEELSTYVPPWCTKSNSPLSTRLQREENRKNKQNEADLPSSPTYIKLGQPGHGAPMRSSSGEIKTIRNYDPEVRFQKRNRHQVHDIIQPKETSQNRNECNILGQEIKACTNLENAKKSSYDILGQPKSEKRNWNNVESGMTRNVTRNAIPGRRQNGECRFLEKPVIEVPCNELPVLKPVLVKRNGLNVEGRKYSERFNPWGKAGNGAPIYDENGNLFTQLKHPKEDLVPFFKKTIVEKELQRKQLEATRELKPEPIETRTVSDGDYIKLQLDSQRNKETLQTQRKEPPTETRSNRVENVIYSKAKRAITKSTELQQVKVQQEKQSNNSSNKNADSATHQQIQQGSDIYGSYTDTYKPSAVENLGTKNAANNDKRTPATGYNVLGQPFVTELVAEPSIHVKFSDKDEIFTNRPLFPMNKNRSDESTDHVQQSMRGNNVEVEEPGAEVVVSHQPVFSVSVQKKLEERRKSLK